MSVTSSNAYLENLAEKKAQNSFLPDLSVNFLPMLPLLLLLRDLGCFLAGGKLE